MTVSAPSDDKKKDRSDVWVKVLAVVTAILAIFGGLVTLRANQYSKDASENNARAAQANAFAALAKASASVVQQSASSVQMSQSSALQEATRAPVTVTATTTATETLTTMITQSETLTETALSTFAAPTGGATVYHKTAELEITQGAEPPDLDASPVDPQWTATSASPQDFDVYSGVPLQLGGHQPAKLKMLPQTPASFSACYLTNGYTFNTYDAGKFVKGDLLCAITDKGRYATMQILEITDQSVIFLTTVYDPPKS